MKIITLFMLYVLLSLSGCTTLDEQKRQYSGEPRQLFQESYFKTVTDKYFGPDSKYLEERKLDFRNLVREGRDDDAKKLRNEVAYDLISISDYLFSEVRDGLFIRRASIDSGSRFYNLLFTTASTVSSVESVKTAFSAAATFLTGTKAIFDEELFSKQARTAIYATMTGRRAEVKKNLLLDLQKSPADYTLGQAIAAVQDYHRAGSLVEAMNELEQNASSGAKEKIDALRTTEKNNASAL
ncbi:hypothetical protein [uncultured Zoogloea sp.]|uniref:hypothetical protein n=1 Tax=uncultured Zoogloea sp. TaxID=160237 RepID=UPI00260ECBFE|nr:hypothetical protein [uncultured Zoogloea sp.]